MKQSEINERLAFEIYRLLMQLKNNETMLRLGIKRKNFINVEETLEYAIRCAESIKHIGDKATQRFHHYMQLISELIDLRPKEYRRLIGAIRPYKLRLPGWGAIEDDLKTTLAMNAIV